MEYQDGKERIKRVMDRISGDVTIFTQKLVQTRSMICQEEEVAALVEGKMYQLGYDEATVDETGNMLGRMGSRATTLMSDPHMDTMSIINEESWDDSPFSGVIRGRKLYGRGTADMECSLAASICGAYVTKEAGLLGDVTIYVSVSTMEEDFGGEVVRQLLQNTGLRLGGVIIYELTGLKIAIGHRGRTLTEVRVEGRNCYISNPSAELSPVYLMKEMIDHIQQQAGALDAGEGEKGSVALTNIYCSTPSSNSAPQGASTILDRRPALDETEDMIFKEMDGLVAGTKGQWRFCDIPASSWTGMGFVFHSFLPAWNIEPEHPLVAVASQTYRLMEDGEPVLFRIGVSTNGVTTVGMFHLPIIIFSPGDLAQTHSTNGYCSVENMLGTCWTYAALRGRIEKL